MDLDRDAAVDERPDHLRAQVLELVGRRDREVALLVTRPMGEVGGPVLARVPDPLVGVDVVITEVLSLIETKRVEDVELDLRAPERRVRDPGGRKELLCLLGDVAGVA